MSGFWQSVQGADENYLMALSNKGLYKRAQRELPETAIQLERKEDTLTAVFEDGTSIVLHGSIGKYTCSCPSRSVCKHLLLAVLAAQAQYSGNAPELLAKPLNYSYVAEVEPAQLEKLCGKKQLREAILKIQMGITAKIETGATLCITQEGEWQSVWFLPNSSVELARCGCKSAMFCLHKTMAVLQYMQHIKGCLPTELTVQEQAAVATYGTDTIPYIQGFVAQIFSVGLARLPKSTAGRFRQLATVCHGQRLANMERYCNRIAGQLDEFFKRSATFEENYLIGNLCTLVLHCQAITKGNVHTKQIGVFREKYEEIPPVELYGLGAHGWHSTGGYTGVSLLFYCPKVLRVLTYSAVLPESANVSVMELYGGRAPWKVPAKLREISQATLMLRGGKYSEKGQLSASDASTAQIQGTTSPTDEALAPIRFDDFLRLLQALWKQEQQAKETQMTVLLVPARIGTAGYDKTAQKLTLPIYDAKGRKVLLQVRYDNDNQLLIQNLILLSKENALHTVVARVYVLNAEVVGQPISHFGEQCPNLGLDAGECSNNIEI